jgi:hypothetical protein
MEVFGRVDEDDVEAAAGQFARAAKQKKVGVAAPG